VTVSEGLACDGIITHELKIYVYLV